MQKSAILCIMTIFALIVMSNPAPVFASHLRGSEVWTSLAPAVQGSGTSGTGIVSVQTFYDLKVSAKGTLSLNGAFGFFNGTIDTPVSGAFAITSASLSTSGCLLSGAVVLGSFAGQQVTETYFGNCVPNLLSVMNYRYQFSSISNPIFDGHGIATVSPLTGTVDAIFVNANFPGSGTCGTAVASVSSISLINFPSGGGPPVGLASVLQTVSPVGPAQCCINGLCQTLWEGPCTAGACVINPPVCTFSLPPVPPPVLPPPPIFLLPPLASETILPCIVPTDVTSFSPDVTLQILEPSAPLPSVLFSGHGTGTATIVTL